MVAGYALSENPDKHLDWSPALRWYRGELVAATALVVALTVLAALLQRLLLRGVVRFARVLAIHLGAYAVGAAVIVTAFVIGSWTPGLVILSAALVTFTIVPVVVVLVSAEWRAPPLPAAAR